MKKTALALLTSFTLTTTGVAFAGGTVPGAVAPAESPAAPAPIVAPAPAVVAPVVAPVVASQAWWVPLLAVALVAVAAGGEHSSVTH